MYFLGNVVFFLGKTRGFLEIIRGDISVLTGIAVCSLHLEKQRIFGNSRQKCSSSI